MLTTRQFELIGRMTIAYNDLEAIIVNYVPTFVLGPMEIGQSLAELAKTYVGKQHTFAKKSECMKTILKALPDDYEEITPHIKSVLGSLTRAKDFARRRNEIVHGEIDFDEANNQFVLRNREGRVDSSEETLNQLVNELSQFVDEFRLSCNDLYTVLSEKRGYHFPG